MKKLNKKGVSLAELLAVVVIMGIIAAIAIPLVGNVIETSKKKAFLGDVTTLVESARTYCLVEKKTADGFCTAYTRTGNVKASTTDGVKAGQFAFNDANVATNGLELVRGTKTNGSATQIDGAGLVISTKLDKYTSKTAAKIGTNISIIYDGSTYWINVPTKAATTGKYITKGWIDVTNIDADLDSMVVEG